MDILACPIDKHYPLDLHVFQEKEEIVEGLLVCSECRRWYPIIDEIPQLLPDDLREQREELSWLSKWKDNEHQLPPYLRNRFFQLHRGPLESRLGLGYPSH